MKPPASITSVSRSDRPEPVFVQIEEKRGEAFFTIIQPTSSWQKYTYSFSELMLDEAKRQDGRLDANQISQLLIADEGGQEGKSGRRNVWFADWMFY